MARDAMTHKPRFAAYARGEAIDRLPCAPIVGNTAAPVAAYLNEIGAGVCGSVRKIGWPVGAVEMESSCRA
jgi:hypothetical protein